MVKIEERTYAIELRKKGFSYSEILSRVPASKASLSLWLRNCEISQKQTQRITEKKLDVIRRGWKVWNKKRTEAKNMMKEEARREIGLLNSHDFLLLGIMLYWAEGAKEKDYKPGQGIYFSNSDSRMINLFLKWLLDCIHISKDEIVLEIYVHENNKERIDSIREYWSHNTGFTINKFDRIYFKKHNIVTSRKNTASSYHGLLRVRVKRSSWLRRKIDGWIEGVCLQCPVV
jgi:hypothetical protein